MVEEEKKAKHRATMKVLENMSAMSLEEATEILRGLKEGDGHEVLPEIEKTAKQLFGVAREMGLLGEEALVELGGLVPEENRR
jgi:hypothetical protein